MNYEAATDPELMELVRLGRQDAFVLLVRRHQEPLLGFFRRMGSWSAEHEDLAQETFLRLFSSRARYVPTAKFTTYLYTLARHVWADRCRRRVPEPRPDTELSPDRGAANDEQVRRADLAMDVQAALECLSEKLRAVVVLSIYQGFRYEEIAAILDVPVGTVKSRMFLALRELKEALNEGRSGDPTTP